MGKDPILEDRGHIRDGRDAVQFPEILAIHGAAPSPGITTASPDVS